MWEIKVIGGIFRPEVRKLRALYSDELRNSHCELNVTLLRERLRNMTNTLKTLVRQFERKEKVERKEQMGA